LLVGVKSGKGLKYVGRVGGGFNANERAEWRARVQQLEQKSSPFDRPPDKRSGEIWHWMKPKLVIQVAFQDWTQDGILRQPRYLGMRADRDPKTVVRETPAHTEEVVKKAKSKRSSRGGAKASEESDVGGQKLTHPDRILYPHDGITKLELAEYFAAVGEVAMPHYRERPLSILRNTHGTSPFFQKHFLDSSGAGLRVVTIPNADKDPDFVVCESPEGLLHLAQIGAVELHSWGSVMPKPTHADRLTFDLDPGAELPYPPLRDAALAVRKLLQEHGLESWVKTTGGKGLHVVAPLTKPLPDWEAAKEFTKSVTLFMERLAPTMFTSKTGEKNRKRKIFIDYLRNGFGATAVAAFSPRWRKGVGVSTPVSWDEIDDDIRGDHFNIHNVPQRIAKLRKDPWKGYWSRQQHLTKSALQAL
jgi:bifunctional non-homologous end joining protein LigD